MIQLSFLGAMSTVGASGLFVDTGAEKLVLDYGTRVQEIPPKFPLPVEKADAILLTQCHLDHCGGIGLINAPVYAIDVTKPLTELLLLDSIKISREEGVQLPFTRADVNRTIKNFVSVSYDQPFRIHSTEITAVDAGHIPGSMMPLLKCGGKALLYTGDFNTNDTRLLKGSSFDSHIDVLITESTYSDRDHPERRKQEKELVRIVQDTLANDGVALLAGFAVGRLQEILLVLDRYGIDYPVYMDGMAKKATTIINRYNALLREQSSLDRALKKVKYVNSERERRRLIKQPCVILTTSGMLSGGPIVWYLKRLYDNRDSSLVLTGYQVEGTPGKTLLETGRYITKDFNLELRMFVRRLDFSSHLGRSELFKFIETVNPEKVFCVHGDHTEAFARELCEKGFDAVAPVANNRVFEIK